MKNVILAGIIAAAIAIGLIFISGPLTSPSTKEASPGTNVQTPTASSEPSKEESSGAQETDNRSATVANVPEEEQQQHGTMPMTQFAERTGTAGEVLHDSMMMLAVNGYRVTDTITTAGLDGTSTTVTSETGNRFLTVDLTVRSIGHSLQLSPNLFKLTRADSPQEIPTSPLTPMVDAGMKKFSLPAGQAARMFLVFESPSFGDNSILKYSDFVSTFEITLSAGEVRPVILASESRPQYTTDDIMRDGSLQLKVTNITSMETDNGTANPESGTAGTNKDLKISLAFQNTGNSTIRIDPSYIFVQDNKLLYLYGMHTSLSGKLASPLKATDLEPGRSIAGDVIISLPAESSDLIFMYSGPSNSFLAVIPQ